MARKNMTALLVFNEPIAERERERILDGIPALMAEEMNWGERSLICGHCSDTLAEGVAGTYPGRGPRAAEGDATPRQWHKFNAEFDAWLREVHDRQSITIVVRDVDAEYDTDLSDWHAESLVRLPDLLPELEPILTDSSEWALDVALRLWRENLATQSLPAQSAIIERLRPVVREVFERHGGMPAPVTPLAPQGLPTEEELLAFWTNRREEGATPVDVGRAFETQFPDHSLFILGYTLVEAGRFEEALDIAMAFVGRTATDELDPESLTLRVEALVGLQRLDEAEGYVGLLCVMWSRWSASALIAFFIARGEHEVAASIWKQACKSFPAFTSDRHHHFLPSFKARLSKSKALFRETMVRWISPIWRAAQLTDFQLHCVARDFPSLDDDAFRNWIDEARTELGTRYLNGVLARGAGGADALRGAIRYLRDRVGAGHLEMDRESIRALLDGLRHHPAADVVTWDSFLSLVGEVYKLGESSVRSELLTTVTAGLPVPKGSVHLDFWLAMTNDELILALKRGDLPAIERIADYVQESAVEFQSFPQIFHTTARAYVVVEQLGKANQQVEHAITFSYPKLADLRDDPALEALREIAEWKRLWANLQSSNARRGE
jgi:hypothetical protein